MRPVSVTPTRGSQPVRDGRPRACLPVWGSIVVLLALGARPGLAADATPLEARAAEVAALFRPDPGGYDSLFSAEFLGKVPAAQLTGIFADYHGRLGTCTGRAVVASDRPEAAKFDFFFSKGYSVPVQLTVDAAPPHRIVGLWLGNPVRLAGTVDEVLDEIRTLTGRISVLFAELGPEGIVPLASAEPDAALAIGSAFKLYVLGDLVRQVEAGERRWEEVARLRPTLRTLPSGMLQSWPADAPVTLHTLATLMISVSDNTATDHLLGLLGRDRVETVQAAMGHSHPERNVPFLGVGEAFRLKASPDLATAYAGADVAGKRALLETRVAALPLESYAPGGEPLRIDTIEWFASARDLCRAVDWLRRHSEAAPGASARQILAINPGLDLRKEQWDYIGYKGGSEPGVLNLTLLLRATAPQRWYALAATWNRSDAAVDEGRFLGLVQRLLQLLPAPAAAANSGGR